MEKAILVFILVFVFTNTFAQNPGSYHIQTTEPSSRFLTIDGNKNSEDDFAWIAPSNNSSAQIFTLEPAEDNSFYLKCSNGLYVSIQSGNLTNESTLQIRSKENRDYFKWLFIEFQEEFVIQSKARSSIEISTPIDQNKAYVVTKDFNNGLQQRWKLNPVTQFFAQPLVAVIAPMEKNTLTGPKMYEVSAEINHINLTTHNNDCRRLQGKIIIDIIDSHNSSPCERIIKPGINEASILLDWSGNLKKDYKVREISAPMADEPFFAVHKSRLEDGKLFVRLRSNIKGCHKGGEGHFDYNCDINYSGIFEFDLSHFKKRVGYEGAIFFEGELPIKAKKNGREDPHVLTLYVTLFYNEKKVIK